MLCVTMTIVYSLELVDEVLDRERRDRVERRARLVHEQHLRLDGDRTGDAEALLLTPERPAPGLSSRSLTSFHRLAPLSDFSTTSSRRAL
jgi:hypothetical protein